MSLRARSTVYGLTIGFAFVETITAMAAMILNNDSSLGPMFAYGLVAGVLSIATWSWTSVLLFYNNKPTLSIRLTRCHTHFVSFLVFSFSWLTSSVLLATRAPENCQNLGQRGPLAPRYCGLGVAATTLSWIIFALTLIALYLIRMVATRSTAPLLRGLIINIAYYDRITPPRALPTRKTFKISLPTHMRSGSREMLAKDFSALDLTLAPLEEA